MFSRKLNKTVLNYFDQWQLYDIEDRFVLTRFEIIENR